MACVAALILGREAGRGLADFSPSPHDSGVARCCTVTPVYFRAAPLSCARINVCEAEVSNLHRSSLSVGAPLGAKLLHVVFLASRPFKLDYFIEE